MAETDVFGDIIHPSSDGIDLSANIDTLFIASGVNVAGEGFGHDGVAYNGTGYLFATIAGNVFGTRSGINAITQHASILVEKTGSVNAMMNSGGYGIAMGNGSLSNDGVIAGQVGVYIAGNAIIHNTGTIEAFLDPLLTSSAISIVDSGPGTDTIENSGMVSGGFGVWQNGSTAMAVTNSGAIAGVYTGVTFSSSATDTLTNSGTITSSTTVSNGFVWNSAVLEKGAGGLDVTNSGHIQAATVAIYDYGTANLTVTNTTGGVISGQTGIWYNAPSGGAADLLTNDGTIHGKDFAVVENGSAVLYAVNGGVISGNNIGMQFDGAIALTDTLDNSGTIRTNYAGGAAIRENGAAALTITNSGRIVGNVVFGTGGGSYDGTQGHITGAVVGAITGSVTFKGGSGDETFIGSAVNDVLKGGSGDDVLQGNIGRDKLYGGQGSDTFVYLNSGDSHGASWHDTIFGFDASEDRFQFDVSVTGVDAAVTTGSLSNATFNADMQALLGAAQLHSHHAVEVTADAGSLAGHTFLVIDHNHTAGYQAADYVIELSGGLNLASLSVDNFI